ncbi:MAG TPA: LamG domain-containing protein, partial [Candidatus Binatia bacterium]|nr:LamG domain-containing protein [Candidatus Binatia bacterium]
TVLPAPDCDLTPGLVVHLRFDGDYADSAGYGVVGLPVNSPSFEAGKIGQAVRITTTKDGVVNNYVSLGYPSVLNFGSDATGDTTDFSVAFWTKIFHQADDQPFLSNKNWDAGGNLGWVINTENDGMKWNLKDSLNGRRDSPDVGNQLNDGSFHHVAVTFRRRSLAAIYVDGAPVSVTSMAPDAGNPVGSLDTDTSGFNVNIGQDGRGTYTDGGRAEVDMIMDDVGIWRRALTEVEVACLFIRGQQGQALPTLGPRLTLTTLSFGDVNISWSPNLTGFVLESCKTLGPDAAWTPVDPALILNNTLTISPCCDSDYPNSRFFRLRPANP